MSNYSQYILVTGGAGYIGSHTVSELINSGFKNIIIVDDLSNGDESRIPKGVEFIKGDFADPKILHQIFQKNIKTVLHFAAHKSAPESLIIPSKYYQNNVVKSLCLLEGCVKNKVENFVFSSSAAVYGEVHRWPITERFGTMPTNPYGWSKLMFEQILKDVSASNNLKYTILRYFNAGGADISGLLGNDHSKGEDLISILIRCAKTDQPFTIFGTHLPTKDGSCIRDMIHVSDLAGAHIKAMEYLSNGGSSGVYNLGSENGYSIKEIIKATKKVTGKNFPVKNGLPRLGDIVVSIASSQKAKRDLGWVAKYSDIEDIISSAWRWEESL